MDSRIHLLLSVLSESPLQRSAINVHAAKQEIMYSRKSESLSVHPCKTQEMHCLSGRYEDFHLLKIIQRAFQLTKEIFWILLLGSNADFYKSTLPQMHFDHGHCTTIKQKKSIRYYNILKILVRLS